MELKAGEVVAFVLFGKAFTVEETVEEGLEVVEATGLVACRFLSWVCLSSVIHGRTCFGLGGGLTGGGVPLYPVCGLLS